MVPILSQGPVPYSGRDLDYGVHEPPPETPPNGEDVFQEFFTPLVMILSFVLFIKVLRNCIGSDHDDSH